MKIKFLYPLLAVTFALPVLGAPVYLDCQKTTDGETSRFSVKLDEQTNKVAHTNENGSAFNTEGFFSANTVTYKTIVVSSGIEVTFQYEINREDLALKYHFITEPVNKEFLKQMPREVMTSVGSCKIVEQTKKAF